VNKSGLFVIPDVSETRKIFRRVPFGTILREQGEEGGGFLIKKAYRLEHVETSFKGRSSLPTKGETGRACRGCFSSNSMGGNVSSLFFRIGYGGSWTEKEKFGPLLQGAFIAMNIEERKKDRMHPSANC